MKPTDQERTDLASTEDDLPVKLSPVDRQALKVRDRSPKQVVPILIIAAEQPVDREWAERCDQPSPPRGRG